MSGCRAHDVAEFPVDGEGSHYPLKSEYGVLTFTTFLDDSMSSGFPKGESDNNIKSSI